MPSYDLYLKKYGHEANAIAETRYPFILKNLRVDATQDYIGRQQPMLLLLGDKDLNVNIWNTKLVVEKLIDDKQNIQVSIIKNATHGMLDAKHFNEQTPDVLFLLKLTWKQEKAFSAEFYTVLDKWLSRQK